MGGAIPSEGSMAVNGGAGMTSRTGTPRGVSGGRRHERSARRRCSRRPCAPTSPAASSALSRVFFADYAREWLRTYQGRTSRGIRAATKADYDRDLERYAIPLPRPPELVPPPIEGVRPTPRTSDRRSRPGDEPPMRGIASANGQRPGLGRPPVPDTTSPRPAERDPAGTRGRADPRFRRSPRGARNGRGARAIAG